MIQGGLFLIGLTLALLLVLASIVAFRRGIMGIRALALWLVLAIGLAAFSLFPQLIDGLAALFTVRARGFFVLTVGLLVALVMIYGNYLAWKRLDRTVQQVSQDLAILRYEHEYGDTRSDHESDRDDRRTERGA